MFNFPKYSEVAALITIPVAVFLFIVLGLTGYPWLNSGILSVCIGFGIPKIISFFE